MTLSNHTDDGYTSKSEKTLTPPMPPLPLDLVVEILCRLPVKFLLQFRSVCKLWKSLISDPKFAKKHIALSNIRTLNSIYYSKSLLRYIFESYLLDSNFSTMHTYNRLKLPLIDSDVDYHLGRYFIVGSCNGILCLANNYDKSFVLVWNPSIRKFKKLPLEKPRVPSFYSYGFGYDHVNDNYKVVVVFQSHVTIDDVEKTEVRVHTLGTNFWKTIQEFPFGCVPSTKGHVEGTFVSGTINWLSLKDGKAQSFIVSFDLRNESYQKILQPNYGGRESDAEWLSLGVLKDSLCMIREHDIWIMKEYGITESWTKLFTISDRGNFFFSKAIYMFADDQVLLESSYNRATKLIVHDPKYGTTKFINLQNKRTRNLSEATSVVCVESLVSP